MFAECQTSRKDFLARLKARGLSGVEFVVCGDHAWLKKAIRQSLTDAGWQCCYMRFLRNALDYLHRRADDDCLQECLQELRWLYDQRNIQEASRDLATWIGKRQGKYTKLVDWVEENIGETLTRAVPPRQGSGTIGATECPPLSATHPPTPGRAP